MSEIRCQIRPRLCIAYNQGANTSRICNTAFCAFLFTVILTYFAWLFIPKSRSMKRRPAAPPRIWANCKRWKAALAALKTPIISPRPTKCLRTDGFRAPDLRATAVLPAFDEASGGPGHPGARPGSRCGGQRSCTALKGKPACVVNRLRGKSELAPQPSPLRPGRRDAGAHAPGGTDFDREQPNLRGLPWWNETVPVVLPFLTDAQRSLIVSELAYQNHIAESSPMPPCRAARSMPTCSATT